MSCQSQGPKAWGPKDEHELDPPESMCEENVTVHECGERIEVPLWLCKYFGRQGAMKHVRPEKYTDNDFSYVKEAWRRRASRDPGGATPALRKQHAVGHDGRLISSGPTRKMGEAYRAFGIKCSNTVRLPVMGSGSAGDSG